MNSMLEGLFEYDRSVPARLRPTYRGAVFILGMGLGWAGKLFVIAILATLMLLVGVERGLVVFGAMVAVAVIAGAVSGTLYGMLQFLARWGHPGSWLRWTVTLFGYFLTFVLLTPKGPFTLREPTFYPFAAVVAGLAATFMLLMDDRRLNRPSTRKYQVLQSRKELWSNARLKRRLRDPPVATAH